MTDKYGVKYCLSCGNCFTKRPGKSVAHWEQQKFCSQVCSKKGQARWNKGLVNVQVAWNKGKTGYMSDTARQKLAASTRKRMLNETSEQKAYRLERLREAAKVAVYNPHTKGKSGNELPWIWLGKDATYNSKHRWIQSHWKKTGICQHCGKKPRPFGRRKYGTEWANLDGNYNRDDASTWMELCVKCHRGYDLKKLVL